VCHDKGLIFEEAPEAYKPIDSVIESLQEAGLINVVAKLKPLISYKTSGGCCL
jgi:release factor H-coupled RctB family protein